jgi:hypothetical protein
MSSTNITNASNLFTRGSTGGYVKSFNWGGLNTVPGKSSWTTYTGPLFNTVIPNTGLNVIEPSDETVSVFLPRNLYIGPEGTLYVQNIAAYPGGTVQLPEGVVTNYVIPSVTPPIKYFPTGNTANFPGSFFANNVLDTTAVAISTIIYLPTAPANLVSVQNGTWVVFINTSSFPITIKKDTLTTIVTVTNGYSVKLILSKAPLGGGTWYVTSLTPI